MGELGRKPSESTSRYDSEQYNRTGSRYSTEQYNRTTSRYDKTGKNGSDNKGAERAAKTKEAAKSAADAAVGATKEAVYGVDRIVERLAAQASELGSKKLALLIAGVAAVGSWIGGSVYYSGHYYPGTTIFGKDCTHQTAEEVREQIEDTVQGYRLAITERGGDQNLIYASQVDLSYVDDASLESALSNQKSLLWPFRLGTGKDTQVVVKTVYDAEKANKLMDKLPAMDTKTMVAPEDAYITIKDNLLVIEPEIMGTTLDREKTKTLITKALDEGVTTLGLDEEECYINPAVYADDEALNAEVNAKNPLLGADFTLDFGDRSKHFNTEFVLEFLRKNEDGSYSVSPEAVWDYTAKLASEFDTYDTERTFYTSIGTTEHLYGGDYGWQLEQDETAQTILDAIRNKVTGTVEPIYTHVAMDRSENDIGDTYIEICIARQEMWLYKYSELIVDTPVVTGNPSKHNDTPAGGVWAIDGKYTNFTLVGEGYRTPVDYWMPFNGGVGIHDLKSRAYFGGTIYLTNGSHGCVNTPLQAVRTIYENVEAGTPVIVYMGD